MLKKRVEGHPAATGYVLGSMATVRIRLLPLNITLNDHYLGSMFLGAMDFREECAEGIVIRRTESIQCYRQFGVAFNPGPGR